MERKLAKPSSSNRDHDPFAVARYARIAADLVERIAAGEYPVGSLLPTEIELSLSYGVSRHTMREALRRLTEAGLISRRRRAGTEVIASQPSMRYRQPNSSINDLLQYGEDTQAKLTKQARIRCNAPTAALLGCETGREWLRIESLRSRRSDHLPICHTTMYLNLELESIEEHVARLDGPVSAMVEKIYGLRIIEIEQSIEAISLDPASARRLGEQPGAPALKAVRRYYDGDRRLIELAIAIHPSERFAYVTRLKRE